MCLLAFDASVPGIYRSLLSRFTYLGGRGSYRVAYSTIVLSHTSRENDLLLEYFFELLSSNISATDRSDRSKTLAFVGSGTRRHFYRAEKKSLQILLSSTQAEKLSKSKNKFLATTYQDF